MFKNPNWQKEDQLAIYKEQPREKKSSETLGEGLEPGTERQQDQRPYHSAPTLWSME